MQDFLFLLDKERIWAFSHPSIELHPLPYKGREQMPYRHDAADVREFVRYMLDNYGNGAAASISFVCAGPQKDAFLVAAEAVVMESGLPSAALYSLSYLLPQFSRKMEISRQGAVCMQYGEQVWQVEGRTVSPCSASGRRPYVLTETDVARLFFAPEPAHAQEVAGEAEVPQHPSSELARYVEQSHVKPKSSRGKE